MTSGGSPPPRDPTGEGNGRAGGRWRGPALDALAGISLANLLLLVVWRQMLYTTDPSDFYHVVREPSVFRVALANLVGGGLLLALVKNGVWRVSGPALRTLAAFGAAGAVAFSLGRLWMEHRVREGGVGGLEPTDLLEPVLSVAAVVAALGVGARLRPAGFRKAVRGALLVMVPFALLHAAQLGTVATGVDSGPYLEDFEALPDPAPADGASAAETGRRAVVVVFDELDGDSLRSALADDPESFPELRRLTRRGAYSPEVLTPGPHTLYSLPALSLGELLEVSRPVGPRQLEMVRYGAGGPELWDGRDSFFAQVQARGGRVALSGWYHPYCRVLGEVLDACHWSPWLQWLPENTPAGWFRASLVTWGALLPYPELPAFRQNIRHIEEAGLSWAGDPRLDVVWIHHPLPHRPWLWEDEGWFGRRLAWRDEGGYRRNLREVDRFVGDLRRRLEASGLDRSTAVVVLSDHPQRYPANGVDLPPEGSGIPVIVSLPGDDSAVRIRSRCAPLYVGNLLHRFFDGSLATHEGVDRWIWEQGPPGCR